MEPDIAPTRHVTTLRSIDQTGEAVAHARGDQRLDLSRVSQTVERASRWLVEHQQADGHWCGEFEGDTILETDYVLLLHYLGNPDPRKLRGLTNHVIRRWINEEGGVPIYPGGPTDVSASVKAYFACKLAGHRADEPFMRRLAERIRELGGVVRCNTFTKLYLAIFGQYDWDGVPTIPPEIVLVPGWLPLSIYDTSTWSRAILVPLAVINALRPERSVPPGCEIDELFVGGRHGPHLRLQRTEQLVTWRNLFLSADRALKFAEKLPARPLLGRALRAAEKWMRERQQGSAGLGAIFPAMVHAVMAYTCLGYPVDHPAVQHEMRELERFEIVDGDDIRVQPCLSPVWDTAISLNALLDSGFPQDHPAIRAGVDWLLQRQTRRKGDWAVRVRDVEPGGWYFEYACEHYPDIDDTFMVLMALVKATRPPGRPWTEAPEPVKTAMRRGLDWALAMQSRNGGWAAYDRDNTKMFLQHVPFADHNAMLDPPTSDITARGLECLSHFGYTLDDPPVRRALRFLLREQEKDGSWFGRWGVNYLYGTWQALQGLASIGFDMRSEPAQRAVAWLKSVQNPDGGWGESCRSYDDPAEWKAKGPSTASQTAWAIMGLVHAGEAGSPEVRRGVDYLSRTQLADGTWDEPWFTGTGFPRVFYIRYHLYRHYFPLWALGKLARVGLAPPTSGVA